MVPQYIFCYRDFGGKDPGVTGFVMSLGGYRVFYALNWIYKKVQMPHYMDLQSWIGGIIEICFFVDYLNYRFTGYSMLRSMELKVLGSNRATNMEGGEGGEMRRRRRTSGDDEP